MIIINQQMKTLHDCIDATSFDPGKYLQLGSGQGKRILIVGESPAENGWRKSGKACYSPEGKLLPTGRRLNELLANLNLTVEICGFTELAKCFIGKDRRQLDACAKNCWPIFIRQLAMTDAKLIILLGVKTLNIFNVLASSKAVIGEVSKISIMKKDIFLLPIFHPSPVNPFGRSKNQAIFSKNFVQISSLIRQASGKG